MASLDMSYARCFPEPELQRMDACNNFLHLLQNDCTTTAAASQQLTPTSTGNNQQQRPLFCEGRFMKTDSQQLYSSGGGWVMKPKKEELELYNDEQLFLSFPSFNWNTPAGRHISTSSKSCAPHHTTKDHIMVERRRREKIRQRLIALSAILPGLKKMDKASVLENATKYLKQLEEHVKTLEEQIKKKESLESVVVVKKARISNDDNYDDSSHDDLSAGDHQGLPEIEARISNKSVLIKIHCQKHTSFLQKLLPQVENLHLTILDISSLPFGNYAMDITISAQMGAEFCLSQKELIRNIRLAFVKSMQNARMTNSTSTCTE